MLGSILPYYVAAVLVSYPKEQAACGPSSGKQAGHCAGMNRKEKKRKDETDVQQKRMLPLSLLLASETGPLSCRLKTTRGQFLLSLI